MDDRTYARPLAVYYEHPDWFEPLFAELERRGVPHVRLRADRQILDPGALVDAGLVLNRMSPSAWQRGRASEVFLTGALLRAYEARGVRVVNGSPAWAVEVSKADQLALLDHLGAPHPTSRVVARPDQAPAAARGLRWPVVVKPNIGGSGAGIRKFDAPDELEAAVPELDFGIDRVGLVQEFVPPRDGHIVRVEVLAGRFLYAIAVHPPADGFNLCPADACVGADGQALERTFCAADAADNGLRVEAYDPPPEIVAQVERITAAAGIEVGGVEYVVDDRDGSVHFYDINALSNFVADAPRVVGFDPFERLADWLVAEWADAVGVEAPRAVAAV